MPWPRAKPVMLDSAIGPPPTDHSWMTNRGGTLAARQGGHKGGRPRETSVLLRSSALPRPAGAALAPLRGCRPRRRRRRRRLRLRSRRLTFQLVLDRAQARDVLQMLIIGLGEGVSAGPVGDKIEFLC